MNKNAQNEPTNHQNLPQRGNYTDEYIIPWVNEPFTLTKEYLTSLLDKEQAELYKDEPFDSFSPRFDILRNTLEIRCRSGKEYFDVKFLVRTQHLFITCTCQKSTALCYHAWKSLNKEIEWHGDQYFNSFDITKLEKLSINQKNYLATRDYGYYFSHNLIPHIEFGKVYGFAYGNDKLYENFRAVTLQLADVHHDKQLIYGLPNNHWNFLEPILIPYYAHKSSKDPGDMVFKSFDKSFMLHEEERALDFHTPNQNIINSVCREMLMISTDHEEKSAMQFECNTHFEDKLTFTTAYKKHLLFHYWKKLIPFLKEECVLAFPSKQKFQAAIRPLKEHSRINLTSQEPLLSFTLTCKEDVIHLRMQIHIEGKVLDEIELLPRTCSFFIATGIPHYYTMVRSLRDAALIHQFEKANFCITVFPEDFDAFRAEVLDSIIEDYAVTPDNQNIGTSFLVRSSCQSLQHKVYLFQQEDCLVLKPMTKYEQLEEVNPLYNGNFIINAPDQGEKNEFIPRDKVAEAAFKGLLFTFHPEFSTQADHGQFTLPFSAIKDDAWLMLTIRELMEHGIEVLGVAALKGFKINPNPAQCDLQITGDQNWFDVALSVNFGDQQLSLNDLKIHIQNGKELVDLPDGSFGFISEDIRQKVNPLFTYGQISENSLRLSSTHFTTINFLKNNITDHKLKKRLELQSLEKISQLKKPNRVLATLRPYQLDGFSWMGFLREFGWGGILADDMGLGKTLQALTLLEYHYEKEPDAAPSLIILPNSLLFNWQQEIKKFVPHRDVEIHHGAHRALSLESGTGKLILTTYGTLLSDIELFSKIKFSYLILDESQAIKSVQSKRFESVQAIQSIWRIAMTGTPIENSISDLYAQLDFVNPGFLGTYNQFKKKFPGIADGSAAQNTVEQLQKLIAPFLLRRTKAEVAKDLPEKTEMVLYCEMLPEQRKIYEQVRKQYRQDLESKVDEGLDKVQFFVLEGLMKLRQICNSPAIVKNENYENHSIKLQEIEEHILEKTQHHKLLIFSSFTATLGLVKEQLDALDIPYAYLDGKMNQIQRQIQVRNFQEEESCRVFLISLKAGGSGLNLTAADYVYILDPWWNPAAEAQAIDRCYRIGQTKHVMAYKMICKDSIEEKIQNMQLGKKALADSLIQTNNSILKSLNKADLLRLFE